MRSAPTPPSSPAAPLRGGLGGGRRGAARRVWLAGFLLAAIAAAGGPVHRVEDLRTVPEPVSGAVCWGYNVLSFAATASAGFFAASDGTDGCELWVTHGAALDATEVRSLTLGFSPSSPEILATAGEIVFFVADSPELGYAIWRSDGTYDGTGLLLDLEEPDRWSREYVLWMQTLGDAVLFAVIAPDESVVLWWSDGSRSGTRRVAELGVDSWLESRRRTAVAEGRVYFLFGRGLWRSDGTAAGTVPVVRADPREAVPLDVTEPLAFGDRVYFEAGSGIYYGPRSVWRTRADGLGAEFVWMPGGDAAPHFREAAVAGTRLLFEAVDDDVSQLWASDGTTAGTSLLRSFDLEDEWYGIFDLASAGGKAYFFPFEAGTGREPWVSDGTAAGTRLLGDLRPGMQGSHTDRWDDDPGPGFGAAGAHAVFAADDGEHGAEPWITDGTPEGTALLADLRVGADGSDPRVRGSLAGGGAFVASTDADGQNLYRTNGAAGGVTRLSSLGRQLSASRPDLLFDGDGLLLFLAIPDGASWYRPWRSDGTSAGTRPLAEDQGDSGGAFVAAVGGGRTIVHQGGDDSPDRLLSTDGEMLEPIRWFGYSCGHHVCGIGSGVHDAGDFAVFTWRTPETGWELWSSDGTVPGTALLADLEPGAAPSSPGEFTPFFGRQLFFATDSEHGREPWLTDGTAAGTYLLADLIPGSEGFYTNEVWPVSDDPPAFFVRDPYFDLVPQDSLWFYDGKGSFGLVRTGFAYDSLLRLGQIGNRTLFVAQSAFDPSAGAELWISDGTADGTHQLRDIWPGPGQSRIVRGASLSGAVIFGACEPRTGCEPWVSDGTTAGTRRIADLEPGWQSSLPSGLRTIGDRVYFTACTTPLGCEPWITDGTAEGTRQLADIAPGPASSVLAFPWSSYSAYYDYEPPSFVRSGDTIYFAADDGTGAELWALPLGTSYDELEDGSALRWSLP